MKRTMTTAVYYANHGGHAVERYDRDSNLNGGLDVRLRFFLGQGWSKERAARSYNL
jgi:hypothetical protein